MSIIFRKPDQLAVAVVWIFLVLSALWPPIKPVLEWDVFGYYLYLPATFIYNDPTVADFSWLQKVLDTYGPTATFYQGVKLPDGGFVMRYPIGPAILNAPFFTLAHISASPLGFSADGFSFPYQIAWICGSLCWSLIGLFALKNFLRNYLAPNVVALALLALCLGTNYFQLAGISAALPHAYLFALYSILLWLTNKWHEKSNWKNSAALGLVIGLIAITRPNEVLIGLVPLFWGVSGLSSLKARFTWLWTQRKATSIVVLGFIIGLLPQLLYWKWRTGAWLYWSYQDPAVGFDLLSPHIWPFLVSFRKGWFIYTPLAILLLASLFRYFRKNLGYALPVAVFILVHLYISSSWTCWWYAGGSFSSRSMVPVYALLALPFGYLIKEYSEKKGVLKNGWLAILILLCCLNLFQTWQFSRGILDGERMTRDYYFRTFGKIKINDEDRLLLLTSRPTESVETLPQEYFSKTPDTLIIIYPPSGKQTLSAENQFSETFEISHHELLKGYEYVWLRATAVVACDSADWNYPLLVVSYHYKDAAYKYRTTESFADSLTCNGLLNLKIDYMSPEARSRNDRLKIYLWHRSATQVKWQEIKVAVYYPSAPSVLP